MKIFISYPPTESDKGTPLLSQNRQFQWFNSPTYIYPVVPAQAASLLKNNGFDVIWNDCIAENWSHKQFIDSIKKNKPDLVAIETKTPVVKRHWEIIDELKKISKNDWDLKIVLMGDHVTALPEESMLNSKTDYVITGGDYDFSLLSLCNHLSNGSELDAGIWYRENESIKNTGLFELSHSLDDLPAIDRDLTNWHLYSEKNGNFRQTPGTYIMSARDCWWGRCTFCSWTTIYPGNQWRSRSPEKVLDEIGVLIDKYKVKEIMDDSGTFPTGDWLHEFCNGMIERGYNKQVTLNCNMRFGVLKQEDWRLMAKAGFRFILFGLESANQATLDKIDKNLKVEQIMEGVRMAKQAGLHPHITVMVGYPWETEEDACRTIDLAKLLFKKGWVDTLQATIVIPYPGTPLFKQCEADGLLLTENWDEYDMRAGVMKTGLSDDEIKQLTQGLYRSFMTPSFFLRKLLAIRSLDDVKFYLKAGRSVIGHLTDFRA